MKKLKWIQQLEAGQNQMVVFYGTSLTHIGAWVRQIRAVLRNKYGDRVQTRNAAESAMHSQWGIENVQERVLQYQPDTVFIEFAINDAYLPYATSVDQAQNNLECMIEWILKERPECEIVLMTMNVPVDEHSRQRPALADYYQMYRDVAQARGLPLADMAPLWERLRDEDRLRFDRYIPDGLHPGVEGSEELITPFLLQFFRQDLPD